MWHASESSEKWSLLCWSTACNVLHLVWVSRWQTNQTRTRARHGNQRLLCRRARASQMEPGRWVGYASRSAAHSPLVHGCILKSIPKQFAALRQVLHVLLKKLLRQRQGQAESESIAIATWRVPCCRIASNISGFALAQDAGTRAALKSDGGCSLLWLQPATRKSPCASPLRALARARIETRSHHESLGRPSYTTLSPLRSPLCAGISPADGWQTSTTNDGLWRNLLTLAWHMGRLRLLAFDELGTKPTPKAPCYMCRGRS